MTIQVGDKVPAIGFQVMTSEGPKPLSSEELFAGKKVAFFAVPGAFTPGCSMTHLPGFVVNADAIKAKGVDTIACMSVNDAFVMGAWGQAQNAEEIVMLADGNGEFTAAIGLSLDASGTVPLTGSGLSVNLNGAAPLSLANRVLADRGTQLVGTVELSGSVSGSIESATEWVECRCTTAPVPALVS